jgi:AraC-like DNA-binding protein
MIVANDWMILQCVSPVGRVSTEGHGGTRVEILTGQRAELTAQRVSASRAELVERIAEAIHTDGTTQPLPGLHLSRRCVPFEEIHSVIAPSLCVVAQGSKEFLLGESRYRYDPFHYLLITADLPTVGQVLEASRERPFLGMRLELAPGLVGAVMVEAGHAALPAASDTRAMDVSMLDDALLDAVVRLTRLLGAPLEADILLPLITREIVFRLLQGAQGSRLRHVAFLGGYSSRITRVIERLRQDYDQPLRVETLARELGMSVSGLHHHFKAVTAMSPLQFQKRLRLQEARRLLLGEDLDAASVAFRVGYRDASQFNREYKSLFGAPPMRDLQRLRAASAASAS